MAREQLSLPIEEDSEASTGWLDCFFEDFEGAAGEEPVQEVPQERYKLQVQEEEIPEELTKWFVSNFAEDSDSEPCHCSSYELSSSEDSMSSHESFFYQPQYPIEISSHTPRPNKRVEHEFISPTLSHKKICQRIESPEPRCQSRVLDAVLFCQLKAFTGTSYLDINGQEIPCCTKQVESVIASMLAHCTQHYESETSWIAGDGDQPLSFHVSNGRVNSLRRHNAREHRIVCTHVHMRKFWLFICGETTNSGLLACLGDYFGDSETKLSVQVIVAKIIGNIDVESVWRGYLMGLDPANHVGLTNKPLRPEAARKTRFLGCHGTFCGMVSNSIWGEALISRLIPLKEGRI